MPRVRWENWIARMRLKRLPLSSAILTGGSVMRPSSRWNEWGQISGRSSYRCLDDSDRFVRNGAAEVFQNIGVLDSFIVMEAASDDPSHAKVELLRRVAAAGGTRLTESLVERAGPKTGPRVRRLLETVGLEHVGAA